MCGLVRLQPAPMPPRTCRAATPPHVPQATHNTLRAWPHSRCQLPVSANCVPRLTDRVDIFAWAMAVYETAERQRPWKGLHELAMVSALVKEQRRPPAPRLEAGHPGLWALVQRAWAQDPAQRPSAAEVGERGALFGVRARAGATPPSCPKCLTCAPCLVSSTVSCARAGRHGTWSCVDNLPQSPFLNTAPLADQTCPSCTHAGRHVT